MEVYLVRHTTPEVPKGMIYGQLDVSLNQNFEEEAQASDCTITTKKLMCKSTPAPLRRCKLLE